MLLSLSFEGVQIFYIDETQSLSREEMLLENNALIEYLDQKVLQRHFEVFVQGAHIVFRDNGEFFDALIEKIEPLHDLRARLSLHYHFFDPQYAFSLVKSGLNEILIGKSQLPSGQVISWIQAERHSSKGLTEQYWHAIDAAIYLMTFKKYNIGPLGYSIYTSESPLVLL